MQKRYLLGIDYLIDVVKGKYKTTIICQLGKSRQHYGQLLRNVSKENGVPVTKKVLTSQLKSLMDAGIVQRRVLETMPPQTEYSLTDRGAEIRALMVQLSIAGEELVEETATPVEITYTSRCIDQS